MTAIDTNDPYWRERAACRNMGFELFFGPPGEGAAERAIREPEAKLVCQRCPVRRRCLDRSLELSDKGGIFGGLNEDERRLEHRNRMRRARTAAA